MQFHLHKIYLCLQYLDMCMKLWLTNSQFAYTCFFILSVKLILL